MSDENPSADAGSIHDHKCACGHGQEHHDDDHEHECEHHHHHEHTHEFAHVPGGTDHPATPMHMTEVTDLPSLISIQPEATVSRTVLSEDGLRIVLFAFDKDQVLTEHTAAMPVTLQVIGGRLRVTADGRDAELTPGDVIYLSTRLPHTVVALEPSTMILSMFDTRQR